MEYGDLNDLFGQDVFSDFFRSIFGGRAGVRRLQRAPAPRPAYQQPITITLEEAYHGTTRAFQSDGRQLTFASRPA